MQRSLGEGTISKLLKRYAFIQEERLGKVYFPIGSYLSNSACSDLRDFFEEGDEIIFTAIRQSPPQADCRYMACSVVKKSELIPITGKITEKSEKYAYAEAAHIGRIFLPYSARNMVTNKPWLGRGIVEGARYELKVMLQPEVSGCSYVAWSINVCGETQEEDVPCFRQNYLRLERQPDVIERQIGIVVFVDTDLGEAFAYATQTGMSRIPFLVCGGIPIEQGVWLRYSVTKAEQPSRHTWVGRDVEMIGYLMKLNEKCLLPGLRNALSLCTRAVVCRVSEVHGAAWLWNDLLGRIYVSGEEYVQRMRCLSAVRLRVEYTGNFEDVPWSGYDLELVDSNEAEVVKNVAQLLQTDDCWKVTYIKEQESYYGFMDNPKFGSAFIAWTDTTRGEEPPEKGSLCRATVYKQYRDRKHQWRAVLVTPLDSSGNPKFFHPLHKPSGSLRIPVSNYVPSGRVDPTKKRDNIGIKGDTSGYDSRPPSVPDYGSENGHGLDVARMNQALMPQVFEPNLEERSSPYVPTFDLFGRFHDMENGGMFGAIGSNKNGSTATTNSYANGDANGHMNGTNVLDCNGGGMFSFDRPFSTFPNEKSPESNHCSSPPLTIPESFLQPHFENGNSAIQEPNGDSDYMELLNGMDTIGGANTWSFGGPSSLSLFSPTRRASQDFMPPPPGLPNPVNSRARLRTTDSCNTSMSLESLVEHRHSPVSNDVVSNGTGAAHTKYADAATQTDTLLEQEIIRKVSQCKKAISQLAEDCPEFFALFVQVKWQQTACFVVQIVWKQPTDSCPEYSEMSAACSRHTDDLVNLARRVREKRVVHHQHHPPHRQVPKSDKRKLREKRKTSNANFISTDGTTSGDDATEQHAIQGQQTETHEYSPSKNKNNAFLRKHELSMTSDLEADCEDNNSTDMDTISSSFNLSQAGVDESNTNAEPPQAVEPVEVEATVQSLNARIVKLEKQLETVLGLNVKLKEENEKLRKEMR